MDNDMHWEFRDIKDSLNLLHTKLNTLLELQSKEEEPDMKSLYTKTDARINAIKETHWSEEIVDYFFYDEKENRDMMDKMLEVLKRARVKYSYDCIELCSDDIVCYVSWIEEGHLHTDYVVCKDNDPRK